jgi:hypothetical protein
MTLKRGALGCSILICLGGCSHLLSAPTQYSSLPLAPPSASLADATPVDVPGRLLFSPSRTRGANLEPFAALQRSSSDRLERDDSRSDEVSAQTQSRHKAGSAVEPSYTASVPDALGSSVRRQGASGNYNRETTMNRLVRDGKVAARPICSGC